MSTIYTENSQKEVKMGLYVHIPFCKQKCYYCDFYSEIGQTKKSEQLIDKIISDLDCKINLLNVDIIDSIFIGGGTPSLLTPDDLHRLLEGIKKTIPNIPTEVSIEANPESLTKVHLDILKDSIVNRLSLGIQTFNNKVLETLNRPTREEDIIRVLEEINDYRDKININFDFITGLPDQSYYDIKRDVNLVKEYNPEHISLYSLMIEEEAPLYRLVQKGFIKLPDEDLDRELFNSFRTELNNLGYDKYEISNYSKPGKYSKHNTNYWYLNPYIGVGPGAVSFYNDEKGKPIRIKNSYLNDYLNNNKSSIQEMILLQDFVFENIMMSLRLTKGIEDSIFKRRFGYPLKYIYPKTVERLLSAKKIVYNKGYYSIPEHQIDFTDNIIADFLNEEPSNITNLDWTWEG
ncbi:radical SAM family heme chaperone HemW [Spirochaeta cellobiosiphila]|uniref:radical SAM family heme chaperone HemW n=1 Tax=Spirochaeta cellobiosiphila TaxID=504483 RepID=UPI00041B6AAF|nr:radical SAM family heme chaperone HemW [Spirochaeta cellobiosiphila]